MKKIIESHFSNLWVPDTIFEFSNDEEKSLKVSRFQLEKRALSYLEKKAN